jgi:hypothetical protein
MLHGALLSTECGRDWRLAGVAVGDRGDDGVIQRAIGE